MDELTPRAARVLEAAHEQAREHGHQHVGTEHLLLGLLDEPDGIAAQVLAELVDPTRLRGRVEEVLASPAYPTRSVFVVDEHGETVRDEAGQPVQRQERQDSSGTSTPVT